jgi:hypothetical protein
MLMLGVLVQLHRKTIFLVFYLSSAERYLFALQRMRRHEHSPVQPDNPYWNEKSQTFEDPDGWRVVLYNGNPFAGS